MSRFTYRSKDGSWGLKGLSWEQLVALPPQVYGALAKLKKGEGAWEWYQKRFETVI